MNMWNDILGIDPDNREPQQHVTGYAAFWELPSFYLAGAGHPRDRGNSAGHTHIVCGKPVQLGRIKRDEYQTLCTTKRWWSLHGQGVWVYVCPKCAGIMNRHNLLVWRDAEDYRLTKHAVNEYMAIG